MATTSRSLGAVICEDDPEVRAALVDTINGMYGVEIRATLTSGNETIAAAAGARPDLVVVDLALAGVWGLRIVSRLIEVAPTTMVVAVVPVPFGSLRADAEEAGATALIELSDLRPLRGCLEQLHNRLHADSRCPCCPSPSGSSAADSPSRVGIRPSEAVEPGRNPPQGNGSSSTGQER